MTSLNDRKVLDFMFNPYLSDVVNNQEDLDSLDQKGATLEVLTDVQAEAIKFEMKAIEQANQNHLQEALAIFEKALELWPDRASIYNNRAQVYRLLNQPQDAKEDLDRAIQMSDDYEGRTHKVVARQAYCQRALIHLLEENKEQGIRDMKRSAEMGNTFAKSYLSKMNPYAALCNQMLSDIFNQYNIQNSD